MRPGAVLGTYIFVTADRQFEWRSSRWNTKLQELTGSIASQKRAENVEATWNWHNSCYLDRHDDWIFR